MTTPTTDWEEEFDKWAEDALDTFIHGGNQNHYLADADCYDDLKERIRNLLQTQKEEIRGMVQKMIDMPFGCGDECIDSALRQVLVALDTTGTRPMKKHEELFHHRNGLCDCDENPVESTTQITTSEEWREMELGEYVHVMRTYSEEQAIEQLRFFAEKTRTEAYEKGQQDAFEGRIENMKTITIHETLDVPEPLREQFRKEGYEKGVRDALEVLPNEKNHFLYSRAETSGFKKCRVATEEAISTLIK